MFGGSWHAQNTDSFTDLGDSVGFQAANDPSPLLVPLLSSFRLRRDVRHT